MNEKSPYEEIQEISNLYTPGCEAWIDEIREMAERHGLPEDEVIQQIGTLLLTLINNIKIATVEIADIQAFLAGIAEGIVAGSKPAVEAPNYTGTGMGGNIRIRMTRT